MLTLVELVAGRARHDAMDENDENEETEPSDGYIGSQVLMQRTTCRLPHEILEWISGFLLDPLVEEDPGLLLDEMVRTNRLKWLSFLARRRTQMQLIAWQRDDFQRAVWLAVELDSLQALQTLVETARNWDQPESDDEDVLARVWWSACRQAALHGHCTMLSWLVGFMTQSRHAELGDTSALQEQSQKVAQMAIKGGHMSIVQMLCKYNSTFCVGCFECLVDWAVCFGQVEIVDWLISRKDAMSTPKCSKEEAGKELNPETIHFLSCARLKVTSGNATLVQSLIDTAGVDGLEWIVTKNPTIRFDPQLVVIASKAGKAAVVHWLLQTIQEQQSDEDLDPSLLEALRNACARGRLEAVQVLWSFGNHQSLFDKGGLVSGLEKAVANGHVEVVQWILTKKNIKNSLSPHVIDSAAVKGHVEVLRLLNPQFCMQRLASGALLHAAKRGDLEMLEFLFPAGAKTRLSKTTSITRAECLEALKAAILHGHVQVVAFLHGILKQNSFRLSDGGLSIRKLMEPINRAARTGSLGVVQWLVKQHHGKLHHHTDFGVVLECAARKDDLALVRLLNEKRAQGFDATTMDAAAWAGSLRIVRFLHDNRQEGCTTSAMDEAATGGFLDVVRFLHENRHEGCTFRAMDGACANGLFRVVQYLQQHRPEGCSSFAFEQAAWEGHLRIVKFLLTIRAATYCAADLHSVVQLVWRAACQQGHLAIVTWLLDSDYTVDCQQGLQFARGSDSEKETDDTDSLTELRQQRVAKLLQHKMCGG